MDEANAPPPTPESNEQDKSKLKGTSAFFNAIPAISMGSASNMLVLNTTFRPPEHCVMKELGIRKVPPDIPATAGSKYRTVLYSLPVGDPQSGKW